MQLNRCVTIWEQTDKKPSFRLNAFRILAKIVHQHPELIDEIIALT